MRSLIATPNGWDIVGYHRPCHPSRVRIDVALAGLCRTDIQAMSGHYPVSAGTILGHEAAGTVRFIPAHLQQQAERKGVFVGSRVAFYPFYPCGVCPSCVSNESMERCHNPTVVGLNEPGAFASCVDVPLDVIVPGPDNLSWRHLAYAEPVAASMAVAQMPELQQGRVAVVGQGRIAALTAIVLNSVRSEPVVVAAPDAALDGVFDAVVETWPTEKTLEFAARALKVDGLLVVKSRPAASVLWPHKLITLKRLHVVGAPYGSFEQGIEWMATQQLNVDHMLGEVYPFNRTGVQMALDQEAHGGETHGKLFFAIDEQQAL